MQVPTQVSNAQAIVLCGGMGARMGALTQDIPKPLIRIHGQPLLWYVLRTLRRNGIRRVIFPLGYKGELIRDYVRTAFADEEMQFELVDTGVDTSIAGRILQIRDLVPQGSDFLLLNSDTVFDFPLHEMFDQHRAASALLTLSSVAIASPWGLIHEKNGSLFSFSRERKMHYLMSDEDPAARGYVNSGIAVLNEAALAFVNTSATHDFEQDVYSRIIQLGRATHYRIHGTWFAVDTQKDLQLINQLTGGGSEHGAGVQRIKDKLST